MGYNPYDYQKYFPKGMFDYPNQPLESWSQSHRLFALNQNPSSHKVLKLAKGLVMEEGHIKMKNGYSNYNIFEIDTLFRKPKLYFVKNGMKYPVEIFKSLKNPKFLTNMGYFYLTDDEKRDPVHPPKIRTGNLVIDDGTVLNLPILNRSSLIIYKNGSIDMKYLKPQGILTIGNKKYRWCGSKHENEKNFEIIIYNSSNIIIELINDPVMGPSRKSKKTYIRSDNKHMLLICERIKGGYVIKNICEIPVCVNDKDMVLMVNKNLIVKINEKIKFTEIDGLDVEKINSAVSIGPMLFANKAKTFKQIKKEQFGCDMATPNNPHEENKKLARGCLLKLSDTKFVSILIDGIPQAGDMYPGVTLGELVDFANKKYPGFISGVCTDPSSTMKAVYKIKEKVKIFGNTHYLAHKKNSDGSLDFWPNGILGRKIVSSLVIY